MADRGGRGSNFRGDRGGGGGFRGDRGGGFRGDRGGFSGPAVWKPQSGVTPTPDADVTRLEDELMKAQTASLSGLTSKMGALSVGGKSAPAGDVVEFPLRPAYGSTGKAVVVTANYFEIKTKPMPMYQYTLEVERKLDEQARAGLKARYGSEAAPEVKGRALYSAIEAAVKQLRLKSVASEFKSKLITTSPITVPEDGVEVTLTEANGSKPRTYKVRFNGPFPPNMTELASWMNSMKDSSDATDQVFPKFPEEIDNLNIILGHSARIDPNVVGVGKGRFFPTNIPSEISGLGYGSAKEIIRGYFQSVRPATGRLLLNVNVSHGIFRKSGNVGQLLRDLNLAAMDRMTGADDRTRRAYFNQLRNVAKILTKARLKVEMFNITTNKPYITEKTCGGFAMNSDRDKRPGRPPRFQPQFMYAGPNNIRITYQPPTDIEVKYVGKSIKADEEVTINEYWQRRFGRTLDSNLPLINVGDRSRPIYVPAEACTLVPGQALKGKLGPKEAAEMILFAARKPYQNAESITKLGRQVLKIDQRNDLLTSFGISVGQDLLTVNARILPSPQIKYAANKTVNTEEGGWNMRGVKIIKPGRKINTWTWVYIGYGQPIRPDDANSMAFIMGNFQKFMAQNSGIPFGNSKPLHNKGLCITLQYGSEYHDMLDGLRKGFVNTTPDLAIVVLPDSADAAVYNALKSAADVDIGLHTVGVVDKKIRKEAGQMQYFANVGLKVNLKFGGANHSLSNEPGILKERTMFVGWDVIHPTNLGVGADTDIPSQVGLVVSTDRNLSQWPAVFWNQKSKQEMADKQLEEAFKSRLQLWRDRNSALPENIVIFRDGVSEGQFAQVITQELPSIRAACKAVYGGSGGGGGGGNKAGAKMPRLAVIVSVKRHQTRFYPASDDPADRTKSNNIKNGTVVDRGVTLTRYWDFFLTAHTALQGTAKPARYTVIHDEIFIPKCGANAANEVERLTHELCYLFGRATKAVSICPPAYYADIVCTRARIHMGDALEGSETATTISGSGGQEGAAAAAREVAMGRKVHPKIANDMYYI